VWLHAKLEVLRQIGISLFSIFSVLMFWVSKSCRIVRLLIDEMDYRRDCKTSEVAERRRMT